MRSQPTSRKIRSQRGVILLMLLIALALMIIGLSVAVPKMSQEIKRERENEMIHRGVQYARGVKKYYKKFGRYPTTIEQLENTNNIRFIRKRYADPMTQDGKWRFVRYGEVQLGQPGSATPGGGSGGALPGIVGGPLGQSSGDTSQSAQPSQPVSPGGTGTSGQQPGQQQGSSFGQPTGSMFGSNGTSGAFGGGPILGVASSSEKKGIHEFDKKSQYKQWLFVYDPNQDRGGLINGPYNPKAFMGTPNQVGTPAGQVGQPGGGMFGNNPAPGQPTGNPTPQPPQQPQAPQ